MKRSLPACLPVPIFNQKKRNRQPLTSVPEIKELTSDGTHLVHESFHFPSLPTDSIWDSRISQAQNAGKKMENRSTDKRANICPRGENMFNNFGKDLLSGPKRHYGQMESSKGKSVNEKYSPVQLSTSVSSYKSLHYSSATSSGTKEQPPSYLFKCNVKLNNDGSFADMPEEEMVQAIPLYQMTFKEKSNSLRIISASVESMKYWSQYSDRIPLLFEILATLDSAVTSGDHGSKLFLLRHGKDHIQCIFYEIDRFLVIKIFHEINNEGSYSMTSSRDIENCEELMQKTIYYDRDLPRLIRGRIHRAVGNYDQKRNLFKCVSVRPASVAEQQAFTEYVFAADREMEKCVTNLEDTK